MPLVPLSLEPGVDSQRPLLAAGSRWHTSNLIRFKDGMPQAIGGWQKWLPSQFDSPPRVIKSWTDLNGIVYTAIGTDTRVSETSANVTADITPLSQTSNPAPDFSTTSGSTLVTVVDATIGTLTGSYVNIQVPVSVGGIVLSGQYQTVAFPSPTSFQINAASAATATVADGGAVPLFATTSGSAAVNVTLDNHGLSVGDTFSVGVSVTVGGVTLFGAFLVQSVVDANNFTIDATASATGTASLSENGGNTEIIYYGVSGVSGTDYGYGIGGYGDGGYGQGSIYTTESLPTVDLWSLENWGETLVVCPSGGGIFTWTPGTGEAQAQFIVGAPTVNAGMFIAMPQLMVVAWGSSESGVQEPLLLKWSTDGDYTVWTPTTANQAGSQTVPSGSKIVRGFQGPQLAMVFTDVDVYVMDYLGGTGAAELVWGINKIADHCGLLSPRAVCSLFDIVYWASGPNNVGDAGPPTGGQFFLFAGGEVVPIPCPVWDKMFQDLDWDNSNKVVAAPNALFGEVAWYYPSISGGTGECDSYVKYNVIERVWDYGKLGRTGWQNMSPAGNPLGGGADSYIYEHEIGTSADGAPLNWSISTGGVMLGAGDMMQFVDWIIPDIQYGLAADQNTNQPVTCTVDAYDFPNDQSPLITDSATFTFDGTGAPTVRVRGRHMVLTFGGQGFARLGLIRYRSAPDGKY